MRSSINYRLFLSLLISFLIIPTVSKGETKFQIQGSGVIYSVIDGDTLWLNLDNRKNFTELKKISGDKRHFRDRFMSVKMRLGNIDTGESTHYDKSKNTKKGELSSNYLKSIASSKEATYVCWDIGVYKRPICSVQAQGIGDIGAHMIKKNMTDYITKYGKHPYFHNEYLKSLK